MALDTETVTVSGDGTYITPTGYAHAAPSHYLWQASYSGDANNSSVTSPCELVSVSQAGTRTTLTASANPAIAGQPLTFTAAVTPSADTITPTGTIQFRINGTPLGSPVPLVGGQATSMATSLPLPGSATVTAAYSGDLNYLASTGLLTLPISLSSSHIGSVAVALGNAPCSTIITMVSVNTIGSTSGAFSLQDEQPGGIPRSPYRAGVVSLRATATTALVRTSATSATLYGQGQQLTTPIATSSVIFRADLASTNPDRPLNGTVSLQTNSGCAGSIPATVQITGCG